MKLLAFAPFCALFAASLAVSSPSPDLQKRDGVQFTKPTAVDEWVVQRTSSQFPARWTVTGPALSPDQLCDISLVCPGNGPIGWCNGQTTYSAGSCYLTVVPPDLARGTYYQYCNVQMLCNVQGAQVQMATSQSFPVAYRSLTG